MEKILDEATIRQHEQFTRDNAGNDIAPAYDYITSSYNVPVNRIIYVAANGLAANDGLTEANPIDIYTAFDPAFTQPNDVYWIKAGLPYDFDGDGVHENKAHLSLRGHGASELNPIYWIGYKNVIGDLNRDWGDPPNLIEGDGSTVTWDDYLGYPILPNGLHELQPDVMPLFQGNKNQPNDKYIDNEVVFDTRQSQGLVIENIQFQFFRRVFNLDEVSHMVFSNLVFANLGWFVSISGQGGINSDLQGESFLVLNECSNLEMINSSAFNMAFRAFSTGNGSLSIVTSCKAYSNIDNGNPQDYYFYTRGRNNWFIYCEAYRLISSSHSGHGICFNQASVGNLAEYFVVEGTDLHMDGASHALFQHGELIGRPEYERDDGGVVWRGGQMIAFDRTFNGLFDDITAVNVQRALTTFDQGSNNPLNVNTSFEAAVDAVTVRNYTGTGETRTGSPISAIFESGRNFSSTKDVLGVYNVTIENSTFSNFDYVVDSYVINNGFTMTNVCIDNTTGFENKNDIYFQDLSSTFTNVNFNNSELPIGFNQVNVTNDPECTFISTVPPVDPPVITGNSNLFFKGKPVGQNGLVQVRTGYFKGRLISLNQSNTVDDVPDVPDVPDTSTAIRFFDNPNLPFLQANEPNLPTFTPTSVADLEDSANANKIAIISNSFNVDGADFVEGLYLRPAGGAITGFNFKLNGAIIVSNGQQIFDKDVKFLGIYTDSALTPEMFLPSTTTDWMPAFEAGLLNCSDFYLDGGDYDIRSRTIFNASLEKDFNLYGNGSRLLCDTGTNDENFVFNVDKVNWGINNLEVDGQNLSNKAFIFDLGNVDVDNVNIHDFLSDAGIQAFGIHVNFDSTSSDYVTITNSTFKDIEATDDENAAANSNSISRAINVRYVDREGSGTILIEDNLIENIFGVDADGIFLNTNSFAEADKAYDHDIFMEINRNTIKRCSRRAIKIQGSNVVVNDNDIELIDFNDPKANSPATGVGFQDIGITFPKTIKNRTLTNNRFTSVGDSEVPFFAASGIEGLIVSGNSFIKPQPDNRGGVQIGGQVNLGTGFAINSQIFDNTFVNCGIQVATMVAVDHPDSGVFIHDNEFTFEVNNTLNGVINLRLAASAIKQLDFRNNIVNMNYNTSNGNFGGVINSRLSSMIIESLTMENNTFNFAGSSVVNEKFARIEGDVLNTNIIRNNRINGITTSGAFEINGTVGFENLNNLDENDNSITCINGDCTSIIDLTQVIGKEN